MRKSALGASILAAAALTLAACGSSSTATTLKQFVASFGSQQYVQVHVTETTSGPGTSKVQPILAQLAFEVRAENPSGGSLASANGTASTELLVYVGTTTLVDVREVGQNVYLMLDPTALSGIPNLHLTAAQIDTLTLLFGGKWYEIPKTLLDELAPPTSVQQQQTTRVKADEAKLIDALANFVEHAHNTKTSTGYTETGTVLALARALDPAVTSIAGHAVSVPTASNAKGAYKVTLTTSGSTVTGVTVEVTEPHGTAGTVTSTTVATVTHSATSIPAPSNATVVTPQLLRAIESEHL